MKKQVRCNVFETNSSSTHAICISKDCQTIQKPPKHITFRHREFGWENKKYTTMESRASYLYQAICDVYYGSEEKEIILDRLKNTLLEKGISCDFSENKLKYSDGHIDHAEELDLWLEAIFDDEEKLFTFLFGDSFIITGNDNDYDYMEAMYDELKPEETKYGTFRNFSDKFKSEFDGYEIYEKGN